MIQDLEQIECRWGMVEKGMRPEGATAHRGRDDRGVRNLRYFCETTGNKPTAEMRERAQGCLFGQLAVDSLGSLVEFRSQEDIQREYPNGVRELGDGGTWNMIAGQPTDDSEMALLLARMLAEQGRYDPDVARKTYVLWLGPDRIYLHP